MTSNELSIRKKEVFAGLLEVTSGAYIFVLMTGFNPSLALAGLPFLIDGGRRLLKNSPDTR